MSLFGEQGREGSSEMLTPTGIQVAPDSEVGGKSPCDAGSAPGSKMGKSPVTQGVLQVTVLRFEGTHAIT